MKLKTRNVFTSILIYFLIFSAFILGFLYLFQILFLSTYYEITQSNSLSELVENISYCYVYFYFNCDIIYLFHLLSCI